MQYVTQEARGMSTAQADDRRRDQVAWGVGLFLFWPALFMLEPGDHKDQLASLKGEYDALNHVAITKHCTSLLYQEGTDQARAQQAAAQVQAAPGTPAVAQAERRCGAVTQRDGTVKLVPC
jgi:hypothetical protein